MSVMCTVCMPGACGSQKKVQDALKLKLQMVDCKLLCGAGNWTQILCKISQCF